MHIFIQHKCHLIIMQYCYIAKRAYSVQNVYQMIDMKYIIFSCFYCCFCVTLKANCAKWWAIPDPLLQSKVVKANQTSIFSPPLYLLICFLVQALTRLMLLEITCFGIF